MNRRAGDKRRLIAVIVVVAEQAIDARDQLGHTRQAIRQRANRLSLVDHALDLAVGKLRFLLCAENFTLFPVLELGKERRHRVLRATRRDLLDQRLETSTDVLALDASTLASAQELHGDRDQSGVGPREHEIARLDHADRLLDGHVQNFTVAVRVMRDVIGHQALGFLDDALAAAIGDVQRQFLGVQLALQVVERLAVGTTERVNRLAIVADHDDSAALLAHATRNQKLRGSHVLGLIDDHDVVLGAEPLVTNRQVDHVREINGIGLLGGDLHRLKRMLGHESDVIPLGLPLLVGDAIEVPRKVLKLGRILAKRQDLATLGAQLADQEHDVIGNVAGADCAGKVALANVGVDPTVALVAPDASVANAMQGLGNRVAHPEAMLKLHLDLLVEGAQQNAEIRREVRQSSNDGKGLASASAGTDHNVTAVGIGESCKDGKLGGAVLGGHLPVPLSHVHRDHASKTGRARGLFSSRSAQH